MPADGRNPVTAEAPPTFLDAPRFSPFELVPWIAAILVFLFWQDYLSLGTAIMVMVLFAVSLDLLTGYAGIITLGQGIWFGLGAYAAGLFAKSGWDEPISGLIASAVFAGAIAGVIALVLCRLRGLLLIMTTLALVLIFYEAAKSVTWLTGGDDGLVGFKVAPLFGVFPWTVYGHTAYLYALGWLFILFMAARVMVASPYGATLRGLRENYGRMQLLGAPVHSHIVRAFILSGLLAGAAGALSAQTTSFVDLSVFSLDHSAGVLVMLVLGGLGRLYGAVVGVVLYMIVHNVAAKVDPYNWMFIVGGLLIVIVLFSRGGILGLLDQARRHVAGWWR